MIAATTTPELWIAMAALATSLFGAVAALLKLGPERQVSIVGAQDTVIDNLREEVERQRIERKVELDAVEARHRFQILGLERQLAEEAETCERRIVALQERISKLEGKEER